MADTEIKKVLKVETSEGERSVKSLKQEINDLRDALLNTEKGSDSWQATTKKLVEAQKDLKDVMNAGKTAIEASEDSIVGMERKYKSLYDTYKLLTEEQRKSPYGKTMAKDLDELSKKLNSTKKEVGNFKDNIGHYAEDMMNAFGQLGMSVGGLQSPVIKLNNAFKLLKANPVLAILAILVGLFVKVKDAIGKNEELQLRLNAAMAKFKPIGDVVALVLDKLAQGLVFIIEKASAAVAWFERLFKRSRDILNAEEEVAKIENDLIKKRREYNELNAEDEARVAQLREEAAILKDNLEKQEKINEAIEIQKKINERRIELAEDEYNLIKKKNEITPSGTEDLNKESEALQKVNQARRDGENALRRLNSMIKTVGDTSVTTVEIVKSEWEKLGETIRGQQQGGKYFEELYPIPSEDYYKEKLKNSRNFINTYIKLIQGFDSSIKEIGEDNNFTEKFFPKYDIEKLNEVIEKLNETGLFDKFNEGDYKSVTGYYFKLLESFRQLKFESSEYSRQLEFLQRQNRERREFITKYSEAIDNLGNGIGNLIENEGALNSLLDEEKFAALNANVQKLEEEYEKLAQEGSSVSENEMLDKERELQEARLELLDYYLEKKTQAIEQEKALNEALARSNESVMMSYSQLTVGALDSLNSILDSTKALIEVKKNDGKTTEAEANRMQKKLIALEKVVLAVNLAQVIADTAGGIQGVWKAYALEKVANAETAAATGPAAAVTLAALNAKSLTKAIIDTATIATAGVANAVAVTSKSVSSIASLKSSGASGGDSGSGVSATAQPSIIDSTPYSYSRIVQTDAEKEEMLNTEIVVKITDIENAAALRNARTAETTF